MAKPCRYRLPGTDTWLSEAEFKKTLNDGLLDKHIEDGIVSIRNFKPKLETAPVAEAKEEVKIPKNKKERQEAADKDEMVYHDLFGTVIESTPEQYEAALKEKSETGSIADIMKYGREISEKQAPRRDSFRPSLLSYSKQDAQDTLNFDRKYKEQKQESKTAPVAETKVEEVKVETPVAEVREVKIPKNKKERIDAALNGDMVYHRIGDVIYESTPEQYNSALKEIAETGSISDASNIGKEISKNQAPDPVLHGYAPNLEKISQEDAKYELNQRTKTEPVAEVKETPKAESTLSKKEQEEFKILEDDLDYYTMKMEDAQEQIDIEKSNFKEEKERISQEKAKVRSSKMSKDEKSERLEELDAELSDIKDDHDDLIEQYKDDVQEAKSQLKRINNRKAKLEQKTSVTETKAEPKTESTTETKAEPVKTEKAPKAEAKESYKAKAIDKRGGDKAYTVTVNGNTADVVGEQRPSPMDPTKMTPGASYKGLPITTNINGQRVVETPTGDTIYLDKPIAEKVEEVTETKERVSEGKGANITVDVPGRSVSSPVVKMVKNRRTNQWQALKSDGTTYETSDTLKEKAEAIYQQTRTDAKVVSLSALEANTRNRQMVFSNTTNKWMEVNGEGILINVTEPSAKAAEKAYNTKREDLKRKIADAFDSKKFNLKGQLNSTPIIQISWNAILELTKKLVLAGADLTFAINDAAKKVTDQMVKENKMTEAEAQEVINYVSSDDFRLRPEYSGMKNALSSDAAKELSAEKIQKMTYKEALDAGERAIESGEINPSEIINQIINVKGRSLDPIETVAMSYYKVGLDNELGDLYERLSKETNEDIQDILKSEIDLVEQKIADYDVMANITGYFNGLSLALRRVMLNSQYDAAVMVNKVRSKYADTKMPEGLEDKLREASNKIKDLNKQIENLKKEAEKSSDSEAVKDIKEDNARRKGKKQTKEDNTYVSSKDGKVSISTALIREAVEQGAETIEDVINYVRADVQAMFADASDRQIRDAISNYGKQVNPTKDEVQKKINEIKSIGRMLSMLEDVQKALANNSLFDNLKSKRARKDARRRLSEQEEQLKRAIREEMAKLPLSLEDIEFMNEQKLESYKKRKENEIAELEEKILRNDLAKKGKQSTILDKEGQELKDKRDALNAQLEQLRKQQPLTDEQIEERRAKRLEQYKKRLADRNKDLQRRIAEKDFSKKAKPESIKKDEEARQLEIERQRLITDYEYELEKAEMASASRWEMAKRGGISFLNLSKGLLASIDVSAPLRQGIIMMLTQNPVKSGKQIAQMFSFWANPAKYDKWIAELKSSEYYPLLKESGLFIAEQSGKLSAMEEVLANNLGNKIPILGQSYKIKGKTVLPGTNLYKRSEYAYSGFLNNLRVQSFLDGANALKEMGLTMEENKDEFKSWASYINNATGRGTMDASLALKLGTTFFSPRLIAARINVAMNPFYYARLSPAARKMALKRTGSFFAMATTITGLAALYYNNDDDDDTSVELDPRSSDFGKIKIKNTRVDFLGGFLPYFRSASQFTMGQKKNLTSAQIEELNQKFGGTSRKDIAMDFFANKLAPIPRSIYDWADKTEAQKEKDKLEKEQDNSIWNDLGYPVWAQNLTVPIWTQDVKRLNDEHGIVAGTGLTMLNLLGAGVQNFKPRYKSTSENVSLDDLDDFNDFEDVEESEDFDSFDEFEKMK